MQRREGELGKYPKVDEVKTEKIAIKLFYVEGFRRTPHSLGTPTTTILSPSRRNHLHALEYTLPSPFDIATSLKELDNEKMFVQKDKKYYIKSEIQRKSSQSQDEASCCCGVG